MNKCVVLYNPYAQKGQGLQNAQKLSMLYPDKDIEYVDLTKISDYATYVREFPRDNELILTGGDGTLSRFIDAVYEEPELPEILFYPAGSGNDFINDLHKEKDCAPFALNEYMHGLPKVTVNGKTHRFINAMALGLDGYCCEEHDRLNALGRDRAYTMIAFLGLLGRFTPGDAVVTVDGERKEYHNVWMAPTMFGSYYGGGVKMGPEQSRDNPAHDVTSVVIHGLGRLRTLFLFLDVCNGKGGKYPKYVDYRQGRRVTVEYSKPVAAQIDGETVLNVTRYEVEASNEAK